MLLIKTTFVEERPPGLSARAWNEISRGGHADLADHWHEDLLPLHFTREATSRYGYQARNLEYMKRKAWKAARGYGWKRGDPPIQLGGQVNNVLSGFMQKMLKSRAVIRAFPSRATLTMSGPRYITQRSFAGIRDAAYFRGWTYGRGQQFNTTAGQQPDKKAEVTKVIPSEQRQLAGVLDAGVQKRLDAYRERKVVTP